RFHGVLRRERRQRPVLGRAEEAVAARHRDRRAEPSRQDRANLSGPSRARPPLDRRADAARVRRGGVGAAAPIPLIQHIGTAARLWLHLSSHHAGQFRPAVPFFTNTFYPPNQPSVRRCFSLGKALADAIASWDADLRVAVIGSGGMSHFVVD